MKSWLQFFKQSKSDRRLEVMEDLKRHLRGTGVGRGIAVAPALIWSPRPAAPLDESGPAPDSPADVERAIARFDDAVSAVASELTQSSKRSDETLAEVLLAAAAMASDPTLRREVIEEIESGIGPATATQKVIARFAKNFEAAGGYLAERTSDLQGVRDRLISHLLGEPLDSSELPDYPVVLIAQDLTPADTATLDFANIAAIIIERGGPTSHTAIIANQHSIPCIVGAAGATDVPPETLIAVNAAAGIAHLEPSQRTLEAMDSLAQKQAHLAGRPLRGKTKDGTAIELLANIGSVSDARRAAEAGAEGIGLLRTEFLYLNRDSAPNTHEQTATYEAIAAVFPNKKVTVRTLDAGSDKPLRFVRQNHEENPALGVRGYRVHRENPGLLASQLQAIQAVQAAKSALRVMAPMISTPEEAREFAELARASGIQNIGVMIETPAAAICATQIIAEVDFVSIGTNDLAQYTMAADRQNPDLAQFLNPWQPALLRLVADIASAGRNASKPVGICGEAAADPLFALFALGAGVSSLSMAAPALIAVALTISDHTLEQCEAITRAALEARSPTQARDVVLNLMNPETRELLGL